MSAHMKIFTEIHWTLVGFVIFFVLFLLLIGSTYLKSQKQIHSYLEILPLQDNTTKELS